MRVTRVAANGRWSTRPVELPFLYDLQRQAGNLRLATVCVTDAEGRITFYSKAAAKLLVFRPELGNSEFAAPGRLSGRTRRDFRTTNAPW